MIDGPTMRRIVVIGNAGCGKTTLSHVIGARRDLPVHHLDAILWRPGWPRTPDDEFERQHDAIVAQPRWVIDGVATWRSIETRVDAADTMVFPDYTMGRT